MIVIGVTLIVGVALFNFDTTAYGLTFAGFLDQQAPILIGTAVAATLLIAGATLYKTAVLSSGGGKVAQDLGGTQVSNDERPSNPGLEPNGHQCTRLRTSCERCSCCSIAATRRLVSI